MISEFTQHISTSQVILFAVELAFFYAADEQQVRGETVIKLAYDQLNEQRKNKFLLENGGWVSAMLK